MRSARVTQNAGCAERTITYAMKNEIFIFIIAVLTVMGYSINDTIVIFDRIRETLIRKTAPTFKDAVNKSLNEVMGRSLAASFTTLLPVIALFIWGGETLKYFALALLIGIVLGTYSSIFIASALIYIWAHNKIEKVK